MKTSVLLGVLKIVQEVRLCQEFWIPHIVPYVQLRLQATVRQLVASGDLSERGVECVPELFCREAHWKDCAVLFVVTA